MHGFVNYIHNDGVLPTHKRTAFKDCSIVTVQSIIAKYATLPKSIMELILTNSSVILMGYEPTIDSTGQM